MASLNVFPSCGGPRFILYLKTSSSSSSLLGRKAYKPLPRRSSSTINAAAKFNLAEVMGGRGLCNGEKGLQLELQRKTSPTRIDEQNDQLGSSIIDQVPLPENAFEKELMGLTGGFPGGEKGLMTFIEKSSSTTSAAEARQLMISTNAKPNPPPLPLLMPGMTAIVKNPSNPFYMYCGIIQRITDGKAGVLFEGGNWDKLITFRLDELERRDKGPPMVNPKSAVLESLSQKDS